MNYKESVIRSQKDLNLISKNQIVLITKAKYGPSKATRIPLNLNEDLAFFVATIIGDGHLKKSKLQTTIELSNKELINSIKNICKTLFNREFNIKIVKPRPNKKQTYSMVMDSKAVYNLLNMVFEIPIGKKSHIVRVPRYIKNSNKKIKLAFLNGIMATEGGRRRRSYGLSTASEQLWKDLIIIFNNLKIPASKDKWVHKKYKRMYYGISFKDKYWNYIMQGCRSGQTE